MLRSRQFRSRLTRHVLPVLLVFAQVVSLVGLPAVVKPSARTACGGTTCGCPADDKRSAACCCSTPAKAVWIGEPESCCATKKRPAKTCCSVGDESCSLPPCGGGLGWGVRACPGERLSPSDGPTPLPNPPPQGGREQNRPAAKACCTPKKSADDRPQVRWVPGFFARGCKPVNVATGLPAPEPAVPAFASVVTPFAPPASAAVRAADAETVSLPSVPPDPPPRLVG